jgi:mercuric reductase
VAIIGSGSAAFACAIKAAEGGAIVTIIEGSDNIGGCCVNVGCVPSKIMIRAAQLAQNQRENPFHGIENREPIIERNLLAQQQVARVDELRGAKYENILASNDSISLIKGWARLQDQNTLSIKTSDGEQQDLTFDRLLIATGSQQSIPPIAGLEDTPYWISDDALFAEELPKSLTVIGSSVIAVEIAQAYQRLGTQVTLLARHSLLYKEEPSLGKQLQAVFKREGIQVLTHTQAEKVEFLDAQFVLTTNQGLVQSEKLLIATGRTPNTQQLNLEKLEVALEDNGAIKVNSRMLTSVEHIYAAGDCSNMPQYVYVAAAAGSRAGINMTGGNAELSLKVMPAVIFTDPQVATVGLTEQQAQKIGIETESRELDLSNVPRALANFDTQGFIKLVAEKTSHKLVGAQILAYDGCEIIQTVALAITNHMTTDDLANQIFPYLTMVEGIKLCAQTFKQDISQLSCCAG